jgi:molecular chaperone HscA
MLIEALDHGETDLHRRRLAENRVEGHRILLATRKALDADADLLEPGEAEHITRACSQLEDATRAEEPSRIQAGIDALDDATKAFAARRMNRAMARAIGGQRVEAIEKTVERAKGIESAHGPHPQQAS